MEVEMTNQPFPLMALGLGEPSTPPTATTSARRSSIHDLPQCTPTRTPTLQHKRSMTSITSTVAQQQFHERHLVEFAHLHNHRDSLEKKKMLDIEQVKLDEARRIGREKRKTLALTSMTIASSASNSNMDGNGTGPRPLSLLTRQRNPAPRPLTLLPTVRHSQDVVTPTDLTTPNLHSPLVADNNVHSPDPDHDLTIVTPNQLGLEMGCATLPSRNNNNSKLPQPPLRSSTTIEDDPDRSIQSSTYSWASSFSGETIDLRTAAHYVPDLPTPEKGDDSQEEEEGEEEILDSPEKSKRRRRKRIVALAHTVRQLEGIGSRDVEDPNFYHVLVKAWNQRPGFNTATQQQQQQPPIWSPSTNTPPLPLLRRASDPAMSNVNVSKPTLWLGPPPLSTPALGVDQPDGGSPAPLSSLEHEHEHALEPPFEQRSSDGHSSSSSNPFRYSYASTIHDLALEGGLQLGSKLMTEKAWLRSPLFDQSNYFDAHSPSAPFPTTFKQNPEVPPTQDRLSVSSSSASASEEGKTGPSVQRLRRQNVDISNLNMKKPVLGTPIHLHESSTLTSGGGTNWGLGFIGDWMQSHPTNVYSDSDFQKGENGKSVSKEKAEVNGWDSSMEEESIEIILPNTTATTTTQEEISLNGQGKDESKSENRIEYQYLTPYQLAQSSIHSITSFPLTQSQSQPQVHLEPVELELEVKESALPLSPTTMNKVQPHLEPRLTQVLVGSKGKEDYSHSLENYSFQSDSIAVVTTKQKEMKTPVQTILPYIPTTPIQPHRKTLLLLQNNENNSIPIPIHLSLPQQQQQSTRAEMERGIDQNHIYQMNQHLNYDHYSYPNKHFTTPITTATDIGQPKATTIDNDNDDDNVIPMTESESELPPTPQSHITNLEPNSNSDIEKALREDRRIKGGKEKRNMWLFILGFIIPGLWIISGWILPNHSHSNSNSTTCPNSHQRGTGTESEVDRIPIPISKMRSRSRWARWMGLDQSDKYVRYSRIGTIVSIPLISGIIVMVVLLVLFVPR